MVAEDAVKALQPQKAATVEKSVLLSVIAPLHAHLPGEMSCALQDSTVIRGQDSWLLQPEVTACLKSVCLPTCLSACAYYYAMKLYKCLSM